MQMPESYRIEGDKLTIIVGEAEYEFVEKKDFIRSDSEKILMKHHAITVLAQNANIYVSMPVLLTSHDSNCLSLRVRQGKTTEANTALSVSRTRITFGANTLNSTLRRPPITEHMIGLCWA